MTHAQMTISVYIPSYNQAGYLGPAIDSVLAQTHLPDQILIIDDASTDGSDKLIREYEQRHPGLVDVIINQTNQGIGSTRRIAVNASKGDLITYLDGDDLYMPRKLELEYKALLDNPEAGFAYSNYIFIDDQGIDQRVWASEGELPIGDVFDRMCCFEFPRGVVPRCELVRRELMIQTDHYESGLNLYQVNDAMLRIARISTCVAIEESTHRYRQHSMGVHRKPYAVHYDTLSQIYEKNANLLDGLEPEQRRRIEQGINRVLAKYAWRAVKQHAKGQAGPDTLGVLHYARAGMSRRPSSAINPKHALRVLRALTRG